MFGARAFQSWLHILVGALGYAGLFALIALMSDRLFEGTFEPTRRAWVLGAAAFIGYVVTALLIREAPREDS